MCQRNLCTQFLPKYEILVYVLEFNLILVYIQILLLEMSQKMVDNIHVVLDMIDVCLTLLDVSLNSFPKYTNVLP